MSRGSCTVFIGNIPYGVTEDMLLERLQQVGPVVSLRILYDKETGKPKGYGFCEYRDPETAESAVRNLNERIEFGGRMLRIAPSSQTRNQASAGGSTAPGAGAAPEGGRSGPGLAPGASAASWGAYDALADATAPSQPTGPTVTAAQVVQPFLLPSGQPSLQGLSLQQIFDVLAELKTIAQQNPNEVRAMLAAHPPIAHAILQAQVLLGLLSAQQAQQYLQSMTASVTTNANLAAMQRVQSGAAAGAAAPLPGGIVPGQGAATEEALIQQLMSLTPAQIQALPPDQRQQVLAFRMQMAARR
jgi:cleavage stimulation factor subunit 2